MGIFSDLQVDVNGEKIFFVDKKILATFSGRLSKIFGKMAGKTGQMKVIFHDFPGGAEGFELITRFCYNYGNIDITLSNIFLLHCAAKFMEIKKGGSQTPDLIEQTERYFDGIQCWTWSELLLSLKQCHDFLKTLNSSSILPKFLDLFVERLALLNVESPFTSSSENSNSSSSHSAKSYISTSWWFEDLVFMNINLFEKVINAMITQKFDHATICSFLFFYQRSKFHGASQAKKRKIIEVVINLLFLLDRSAISCRGLFDTFGMSLCLKISKFYQNKLEVLVGSKLDRAKIDDLLVPSPHGKRYMYDVNLVLRLLKLFLAENRFSPYRLKKVACLMDLYIAEVAPDRHLKPSKFVALATALPDFARDSQDRIYLAIDAYLKVHGSLCQEEKMKVCSVLNHNMFSMEYLTDLSMNSQQYKLKSLIKSSKYARTLSDSSICHTGQGSRMRMWMVNTSLFKPSNSIFRNKMRNLDHIMKCKRIVELEENLW
ncbi:BTB/POZ domain-containing protein At3g22104-like isoform X1 [Camellia sinensis]|uniref:BTB/POZ domain-containing protein At3g22104-like isoform X1 n=2 Tax=Camellia sinensis TaxID=4442 RepID=UPI00103685AA|nr:BTB/POZ domain-containing protein At3g22104-like isoform X1 [Camellia sinensis]